MAKQSINVDFSGYVTKNDVRCKDGRVIRNGAFKHNDGNCVPLVWQHLHNEPGNVVGKVFLENRNDGIYGYASFNNTSKAKDAKELISHGDINAMSIYANHVEQKGNDVIHGDIVEVSLVMVGANPGATIDYVAFKHSDGTTDQLDDEMIINNVGSIDDFGHAGYVIDVEDGNDESFMHVANEEEEDDGSETVEDIFDTLTDKQKTAVYYIIGQAAKMNQNGSSEVKQSDDSNDIIESSDNKETIEHSNDGGTDMKIDPFSNVGVKTETGLTISHSDIEKIAKATFDDCRNNKTKFHDALIHAASDYGITNIEILFPDARTIENQPGFVKRRTEWVNTVITGTKHLPFSRIKSQFADITADEARARGYIKGKQKIEEVFPVMQRETLPQTIYKKQKLDRDDILDITSFDVVAWLRSEMRIMWEEELARAVLIGDGRLVTSEDKIKEDKIRPIWSDDDFYSYKLQLPANKSGDLDALADAFVQSRLYYEGAGRPVTFMSPETVTNLMLQRDKDGYRLYKTEQELADALRVSKIIEVPVFYNKTRTGKVEARETQDATPTTKTFALNAIIVNLSDYAIGTDRGGELTSFDDFDIDYNQYKYLIEGRCSGALTGYHSAVVIETEVASTGRAAR